MSAIVLSLVFFSSLLLVVGVYAFANRRRLAAEEAMRGRLMASPRLPATVMRDDRRSAFPFLDRLLTSHPVTPAIERALKRAGSRLSVGEFLLGSAALGAIGLFIGQPYGLWVVPAVLIGAALPTLGLRLMQIGRRKRFEEQLPEAIDMIVNAMRAGFSLPASMRFAGEEMEAPLGDEFLRFYDEQRLGVEVTTALTNMQERIESQDLRMFVTALTVQRESGGNLTEILAGLATIIRDREALRGQIDTLTAEPRFTGWALSALPVIAFVAVMAINPVMMQPMFETTLGRWLLVTAVGMIVLGFFILRRMARIEP